MNPAPSSGLTAPADAPAAVVARRPGTLARLLSDRWAMTGAAVVVFFVLLAVFAPELSRMTGNDPYTYHLNLLAGSGVPNGAFGGVSGAHWLGVEPQTGRDLLAIVAYGARISLLVGVGATAVATLIGTVLGVIAGYSGGVVDTLLSRFTDLTLAFPQLIFMISLASLVPSSFPKQYFMILVIGMFGWPSVARVVRGQTKVLRNRSFVVAARAVGASPVHILFTEILPNLGSTITVIATMSIPGAIGTEAALSFLGIGVPPPTPSWGREIASAIGWVSVDPWYVAAPGIALFLVTLSLNAFGDGLRDALDPRMTGLRASRTGGLLRLRGSQR
jgi:peptide/nickel transport system permease protein